MTEQQRVLIVDDDPQIREIISASLTPEGFEVRSEGDVTEAHRVAQTFRPDVVVLDVLFDGMPKGLDLARHLRSEDGQFQMAKRLCPSLDESWAQVNQPIPPQAFLQTRRRFASANRASAQNGNPTGAVDTRCPEFLKCNVKNKIFWLCVISMDFRSCPIQIVVITPC